MAAAQKVRSVSLKPREEEGRDGTNMLDVFHGTVREKIMLQRLLVIARLPRELADRTELGAHYEKLNFQLSKQFIRDHVTGLLLIYPSCLLHVIEASRDVLLCVLRDLGDLQQRTDRSLLEVPKVLFMAHDPQSRLFQQWSYKVLDAGQVVPDPGVKGLEEEEEESTERLVCRVLSGLQNLGQNLETSKETLPGSVLDQTPELRPASQQVLEQLLARAELQSPQAYLRMYDAPLHVSMEFGQVARSSCLATV